jgi:hypothetical protein
MQRQLTFSIIFLSALFHIGLSQTQFSLSGTFGYFSPQGDWKKHMYAEGIDQFRGSYSTFAEFEIKFKDIGAGLIFNYSKMSTADWEDFVRNQGGDIYVSASHIQIGGMLKYYIVNSTPHLFNIEAGTAYLSLNSNEQFNGYAYPYDFLKSGMAVLLGLEYQYSLNERLAVILPLRMLWRPEGVTYSNGKTFDIFALYITPGLKLIF